MENEKAARGTVARMARALRGEYYGRVVRFLDGDVTAMPVCHAGFLSVHIGADGDVWSCCVLARSFGNLRDHDFDFEKVWFSEQAEEFRTWMRGACACPLANAAYTNLLVEPAAAVRMATGMVKTPKRIPVGVAGKMILLLAARGSSAATSPTPWPPTAGRCGHWCGLGRPAPG